MIIVQYYMRPQSLPPIISSSNIRDLKNSKYEQLIQICTVFSPKHTYRSRKRSISLIITLIAFIFHCLASLAFAVPFLWFQLNSPFCWSGKFLRINLNTKSPSSSSSSFVLAKEIGYYNTVSSITWCIGSLIGMKFVNYTGYSDVVICCISHLFFIASALWVSQAYFSWQLYLGLLIAPFTSYQGTLTYSIISKWLEPHEINHAYTFVTEINTILNVFGNSFFNYLYSITVSYSRNLTLLLSAALAIIPFLLNCLLYKVIKTIPDESDHRITECQPILITDHIPLRISVGTEVVLIPATTTVKKP